MSAAGTCKSVKASQALRNVATTASAGIGLLPVGGAQAPDHLLHGLMVLAHMIGVPAAVRLQHVATGTDVAPNSGQQQLIRGTHQIEPRRNAPLWTSVGQ